MLPGDRYKRPIFDLILLGIGNDGHTASLFPDTEILSTLGHSVAAVHVPKLESWRISLTFPTLNAARQLLLVASGKEKADIIAAVHDSNTAPGTYPVQRLMPSGIMHWYLDAAAGSKLKRTHKD